MKIEYRVHSVVQGQARVIANVEKEEVSVTTDCIQVDFSPVNPRHGALMLKFIKGERAEAAELFTPSKIVTLSIE